MATKKWQAYQDSCKALEDDGFELHSSYSGDEAHTRASAVASNMIDSGRSARTVTLSEGGSTEIKVYAKPKQHDGLPVAGYRPQNEANVERVNLNKRLEEQTLRALDVLAQQDDIDKRWLAIGRTEIEKGFMAVNRAVFKPGRAELPEDKKE